MNRGRIILIFRNLFFLFFGSLLYWAPPGGQNMIAPPETEIINGKKCFKFKMAIFGFAKIKMEIVKL